jgi:hypothetical protein
MGLARRSGYNLKTWEKVWAQAIGRSQVDSRDLMEGLVDILLKQWFNSIWVIQEVALATKEPVMLVGRAWCYPQALRYLCDAIFSDPRMNATVHRRENIGILISFDFLLSIRQHYRETTGDSDIRFRLALENTIGPSLFGPNSIVPVEDPSVNPFEIATSLEAIVRFSRRVIKAIKPHDYLYGILGLVHTGRLPDELMPEYSKPYQIVYQ